mmetsp:Transcript_23764/g.61995  ORF Transcript_23764/g.61995 Transcript_23764/m.61995 type:complete len:365 (-) Transcript_23764:290-1384(-)
MAQGRVDLLLPALVDRVRYLPGQVQPERPEVLVVELEAQPDQQQHQLRGGGQVARHRAQRTLRVVDGLRELDCLLEGEIEQGVQVVQRRGLAVFEFHQQPLLDHSVLLCAVRQVGPELLQVLAERKVVVHQREVVVQGEAILVGDGERLGATLVLAEMSRQTHAQLLAEHPQRGELCRLHAELVGALREEHRGLRARRVLHRQHRLRAARGRVRLRQQAAEEGLEGGRRPVAVELDLVRRGLHGRYHPRHQGEGQPELGDRRPRLAARGEVGGAHEHVQARAENAVPDAEHHWHDLGRPTRSDPVDVHQRLGQGETHGCLEHDRDVLHWPLARRQRNVQIDRALHHLSVDATDRVVWLCIVLWV